MTVFNKDIRRDGQRSAGAQNGAVVSAPEKKRRVTGRKEGSYDAENVVFAVEAQDSSRVR